MHELRWGEKMSSVLWTAVGCWEVYPAPTQPNTGVRYSLPNSLPVQQPSWLEIKSPPSSSCCFLSPSASPQFIDVFGIPAEALLRADVVDSPGFFLVKTAFFCLLLAFHCTSIHTKET